MELQDTNNRSTNKLDNWRRFFIGFEGFKIQGKKNILQKMSSFGLFFS
ncbi:hypothetical protein A33Q_1607 [Indibacter alkaliphilus LW1]|uniref:Uncharacterized protein n=1 Tax=Indibacter alkaliphilus (strain CCUG 57479 / KCTC 22604 / LW1) TaxID=1189612 RepID=S2E696_INDAL|nr:hypothetical protein A33Q_1607 [Indibacter alkaliphilus LW1]